MKRDHHILVELHPKLDGDAPRVMILDGGVNEKLYDDAKSVITSTSVMPLRTHEIFSLKENELTYT